MRTPAVFRSVPALFLSALAACAPATVAPPAPAASAAPTASALTPPSPTPPKEADSAPTVLTAAQRARDAALLPEATAVLSAFVNHDALLTRSGAVVFTSNRDGVSQIYVGDVLHPKDAPRRLPAPNERVEGVTLTPDERSVLFVSDTSADGNFRVYRVGLDGTGLTTLTPGERLHRDGPVVARKTRDVFAYSAHGYASERTTVFVQHADGSPPREVYADARGGWLADVSPDGKRALFDHVESDTDSVVYEVDVASGKATRLFPPEGAPKALVKASYSATGDRVFVAQQLPGKNAELALLERGTGKERARYEEAELSQAELGDLVVSPSGDWIAVGVDAGNRRLVRILDARTLQLRRTLETPLGTATADAATADGKRLTLTESHPSAPMDVFVADPATGRIEPLRDEERAGLAAMAAPRVSVEKVASFDGLSIPVNLYLPARANGRLPTLVSIHGGPSGSAAVRWSGPVRFYTSLGYAIVEPNIRGSSGFGVAYEKADDRDKRADALKDVAAVNAWARAQPWCDPDRITIMGGSYGGYMTLLALARLPTLWRAGLDISGMSDLRTMEKLEDQSIRVFDETEFGVLGKQDDLLFEWSPLKHVDAITAPVFVYQGVHDPITPQNEADQVVKALRERGVAVEYMLVENEGHGLSRRENYAEYLARTARFLEEDDAAPGRDAAAR